jgi:hypothetical protein
MEDLYTLPDGSTVDISKYSELERMQFLLNNEGAKKSKGGAKSAIVAPKSKQALPKSTDSKLVNGPSSSQKFRLPTLEELQRKGEAPPPSESADLDFTAGEGEIKKLQGKVDVSRLYNMVGNTGNKVNKQNFKLATTEGKKVQKTTGYFTAGQGAVDDLIESIDNPGNKNNQRRDLKYDIDTIKYKIQLTDSDLINPYLYYSSKNKKIDDSFVDKNYSSKELDSIGVNPDDFDGFLNKKGYKDDFLKKEAQGIYEGTGNATLARYDIGLAKELAKKKMLNMYMEDMQQRDFTRQDLNQDLEITFGVRDKKEIVKNDIFDSNGISKYVEKNFPIVTQKLKDRDAENMKIYEQSKAGGTDFWSWDTAGKMGKSGWNAVIDRTKQISSTIYDTIGMDATAEGIRALDEENKFLRPDDRGVSFASGKTASYKGTDYLVDSRGEIYDKEAKIRVTDLFYESEYKNILETSKYGSSDWIFSPQGAAVQTAGVMADMLIQAAVTRGVGKFGIIASESRVALNGARQTSKFTSILNDSSQLLRKIPLDRATGYSMIAQGALGYSQGYEDTLKAARDAGITDSEAFKLASVSAQRMAILYSTTGAINPQTKLVENLFGSKNIIKKAIEQYTKTGEKGFVKYIDDIIKSTPRNIVSFAEEGGKEVVQENIQQAGELGVNKLTNEQAGKKILNETMSGDDFMNTSILSFISSGLISKMKMPNFKAGNEDKDNLSSLSTLAKNKKEFIKIIDGLVDEKVFDKDQADNLKSDVDVYSNNINKLPKSVSAKAAMPILRSLDKIQKLKDEKESLDKAFYPSIDEKIKKEETIASNLYNADELERKNKNIANAIKKGVVKNISMKTFANGEEIFKYLTQDLSMSDNKAREYVSKGGFFLDEELLKEYSKDPSLIKKGQKVIIVNENYAIETGNTEVAEHEFLHGLIHETIKNDPEAQQLLGRSLTKELMKMKDKVDLAGTGETPLPQIFVDRFSLYIKKYQKEIAIVNAKLELKKISKEEHDAEVDSLLGDQWEEALTIYSDAISNGSVKYDEGTFTKLKDVIRQVLQNLGIKDIKFESGRDVYNFLKDYNKSVESGTWGSAMKKLGSSKAEIDREKLSKETGMTLKAAEAPDTKSRIKLSLGGDRRSGEKKSSDDIKKDVDNAYNKETFTQKINSQRDPLLYDIVEEYEYLIRGKAKSEKFFALPGFKEDRDEREKDFVQETKIELIPHIRNFNKEFLALREEYKQDLISKGFDPNSKEFKEILDAKDAEGYKGEKGIVKENNSLNGWINSQVLNKMRNALKRAGIVGEKFDLDFGGEDFVEGRGTTDIGEELDYLSGDSVDVMEATEDFNEEQEKLANILKDPVFRFVDEKGDEVIIDTVPERGDYVISAKDQGIEANKQLKTETDPARIEELKSDLRDLQRGLDLQNKEEPLTPEEKQELKSLKPTKAFNLTTGNVEYVFKAIIKKESPAKIIARQVAEEILRSPNVETLEFRNFKKLLSDKSMTMMKRITFETGEGLESLMYNNWKLVYDVINNPVDEVTGQSSYASKKIPPYLKERNEKGELQKVANINRSVFLQSFYSEEDAKKIIRKYNLNNAEEEISKFLDYEQLTTNAWFDRRTALRELFGDVMVLQEARRLLRNPDFIEQIGVEKPNLYNSLKDDVIRTQVLNDLAKGKSSRVKFSLSEKANAAMNPLLASLNLTQQSVIARDIDKAIMNGKLSELAKNTEMDKLTAKLKKQTDPIKIKEVKQEMSDLFQADTIPFKVPRMSDSTDKAIAIFIINKMAEGYNSFDFHVNKNADGPLTKQVLNTLDANNEKIKQTAFRNSNLELTMNEIIEENKGIPRTEIFSEETAKNIGKGKKLDWAYLPPGDEDFEGLLYKLASGKGAIGEAQVEFFNENLIIPYSEAMTILMVARQKMYGDWKDVITKQHKGIIKLLTKQTDYEGYTYDQAVRVYLWDNAKYKIPGINNKDKLNLTEIVRTNPKLRDFANLVSLLSKQANGYIEPEKNWSFGSILGDMNNIISTVNRAKYLKDWQNRADKIFSKENLSKIEAVYGGEYVEALKNMLARLKSGTNRDPGANSKLLNWLNKSTANVMFLNTRSSVLQLLSAINFINTSDNSIAKAGIAFANVPQFWKDVRYIWNSPYLKDRRSGLMSDVAEAEIAQLMDSQRGDDSINKYKRIVNWISKNGFIGTRVFDAAAIAFGGASFYRNRLNTYKKQGYTDEQAEKKTMADFYQTSEKSQQSADVSKISQNQASTTGRILLSFMNTPFQYSRIMKKAAIDIAKGRGSIANNIGKIVYYGAVQNLMFNALQNLIFAVLWSDDDDDEEAKAKDSKQRTIRTVNGMLDNILKGMGMRFVALSVVKNALMKWYETTGTPEAVSEPVLELLNISPMVGIKARQIRKGIKALEYNEEFNPEGDKVIPTKAIVEASCSFVAVSTNLPVDRIYQKVENIRGVLDSENENWQRIALAFGYSEQNLGIKKEKGDTGSVRRGSGLKSPGLSSGGLKSPGLN